MFTKLKWKIHFWRFRFQMWLRKYEPVFCFSCRQLMWYRNAHEVQSFYTGKIENVCAKCYHEYFGENHE